MEALGYQALVVHLETPNLPQLVQSIWMQCYSNILLPLNAVLSLAVYITTSCSWYPWATRSSECFSISVIPAALWLFALSGIWPWMVSNLCQHTRYSLLLVTNLVRWPEAKRKNSILVMQVTCMLKERKKERRRTSPWFYLDYILELNTSGQHLLA